MNGKDIFLGLRYVGDDLIEKAEYGQFPVTEVPVQKKENPHRRIPRPILVAAILAMLLMLVGCAVVYLLSMKEIKLGDQTATRDLFEYDPNRGEAVTYLGQETYTQQVLTLAGMRGTPAAKAAQEWYAFLESYDPDQEILKSVWKNPPQFPAEYASYGLYTQEMKDKLDEIVAKYGLKLRGSPVAFPTSKQLFRALGMQNILNPDSSAQMRTDYASYYDNGSLDVFFTLTIPESDGAKALKTNGNFYYRPKDSFISDTAVLTDAPWEEWNYTTASGNQVLMIRSEEAGSAWIFADMAKGTASLRLDIIQRMTVDKENFSQTAKFELLSKKQLEQVADAINFSLEPQLVEGWESLSDGAVSAGKEINSYGIAVASALTDGYGYRITLRITAPDGVVLVDPENSAVQVGAGEGSFGQHPWITGQCREDGDGKQNTCYYILSYYTHKPEYPEDGSLPYPEGHTIPIYWEDLIYHDYDSEKQMPIEKLLTEGTWSFDVPLNEADTREIELLTQPITAKACTGWKMDGTDVIEDRLITSIKLRSLGLDLTTERSSDDFFCFTGQFSYVVMKDGSTMEFVNSAFDEPIHLEQVAYVQLADQTILPMPGVDAKTVQEISQRIQAERDVAHVPAPEFKDGVELLEKPITLKSLAGYATDATGSADPLYEYLTMTSIILHPNGLAVKGPEIFDSPEDQGAVVMQDGTQIQLTGMGGSPYCDERMSQMKAASVIDLSKADHVLLPDGTKLPVPKGK